MELDNLPMIQAMGSQDAERVKEVNQYSRYEWMLNKWGRKVPVALHLIQEKLGKGYVRTDGKVYEDDPATRVKAPVVEVSPAVAIAKLAEQMVKQGEIQTEAVKEIAKKRRNTGARTVKAKPAPKAE